MTIVILLVRSYKFVWEATNMNTPNKLTVFRICLVPFLILFLLTNFTVHRFIIAELIFILASLTDHFDGKIARKNNLITDFGKFADPLADKILVFSVFICFVELGFANALVVIIMIIREFIVISIRLAAVDNGKVIAANSLGKIKTVSQIVSILVILFLQYVLELINYKIIPIVFWDSKVTFGVLESAFNFTGNLLLWLSAVLSIVSGCKYVWDNREFIKNTK